MKTILYFADAFAADYLEEIDFMPEFWNERKPLETIVGYSSTILPVLITGHKPQDTGIWTEYYRCDRPQSRLAKALTSAPKPVATLANMARLVLFRFARKAGVPAAHRLRIAVHLSHYFERHDMDYHRFPPVALPVPTIADLAHENGMSFDFRFLGHDWSLEKELERVREALAVNDVVFLYDPSIDGKGHIVGADAKALRPEIDRVADFLSAAVHIIEQQGDDAEVLLFSDHGMTNIDHGFDIFAELAELEVGKDYLVFVDSTIARFWYNSESARERVHALLAGAPAKFLSAEDKTRYGLDFDDDRYAEDILVIDESWVFHPSYISPTFFRTKRYPDRAMHGYLPEVASAYGICCYRGSRRSRPLPDAIGAADVFGVVKSIFEGEARASA